LYLLPAGRQINLPPPPETGDSINAIEQKFFNTHRTADASEKAIVEYMKRQNDKLHFVAQTVKQIGYPRWDKAIAVSKTDASVNGRGQTVDSANIYYVPFVRDSENFVNASLLISTELNDTTFEYKCNWQYKNFTYGTPHQDSTAERYALFFMIMDYRTFGYTQFKITDTNLFYNNHPYNGNGRRIGLTISNQGGKGYSAYVENLEVCAYYYHCGTPDAAVCNDADGCDFLDCSTGECYLSDVEFCDDSWPVGGGGGGGAGNGGGNGGGTGGAGGTGGGSGSGGGGTPPECGEPLQPLAGRTNIVDPCGPGWVPDYGDDPPPQQACDSFIDSLQNDATFADKFKSLNNTATTNLNYEKGFSVVDRATNQYIPKQGDNWNNEIIWNIPAGTKVEGILHSHFHGRNSIFSPQDVIFMAQIFLQGYAKDTNNLYIGMTGHNNLYPYLLKITNASKFRNFAKKIAGENGDDKYKMDQFISNYERLLNSPVEENNTKAFLKMMQEMGVGTGLSLYRGNEDCKEWTKINLDSFDDIIPTNCF